MTEWYEDNDNPGRCRNCGDTWNVHRVNGGMCQTEADRARIIRTASTHGPQPFDAAREHAAPSADHVRARWASQGADAGLVGGDTGRITKLEERAAILENAFHRFESGVRAELQTIGGAFAELGPLFELASAATSSPTPRADVAPDVLERQPDTRDHPALQTAGPNASLAEQLAELYAVKLTGAPIAWRNLHPQERDTWITLEQYVKAKSETAGGNVPAGVRNELRAVAGAYVRAQVPSPDGRITPPGVDALAGMLDRDPELTATASWVQDGVNERREIALRRLGMAIMDADERRILAELQGAFSFDESE